MTGVITLSGPRSRCAPGTSPSDLKDTTVRRLALLCLAVATLTPVAVALPPLLDHAAADPVPRPVPPGVTATAFAGIARASGTPALAAARVAPVGARVAALTGAAEPARTSVPSGSPGPAHPGRDRRRGAPAREGRLVGLAGPAAG